MPSDPDPADVLIDPLAALQVYCRLAPNLYRLVEDRVADQPLYGDDNSLDSWTTPDAGLVIVYDTGGRAEIDLPDQSIRIRATCYGRDPGEASAVYLALQLLCRRTHREVVLTENGNALIYWLTIDGTPRADYDSNLKMDILIVYLLARVAETPVP